MQDARRADTRSARGGGPKEGVTEVQDAREGQIQRCGIQRSQCAREDRKGSIYNRLPSSEVGLLLTYKKTALTGL